MCRTCGRRHNSLIQDASPGPVPDLASLDSSATSWMGGRSPGKYSPFRGRTLKEYEEELATLKKDNFALKLRIYFLEDRTGQKGDRNKDDLHRTNIQLKVETEALKKELYDKQELLRQASTALMSLEHQHQQQLSQARQQYEEETEHLTHQIQALQKDVDNFNQQQQAGQQEAGQGELTQLCSLAFNTEEATNTLTAPTTNLDFSSYPDPLTTRSPVQGVFSLPSVPTNITNPLERNQTLHAAEESTSNAEQQQQKEEEEEVEKLRERIVELEGKVEELEEELSQRQDTAAVLEEDLANLRKEVEEKVERIGQLEQEVEEKDEKVEAIQLEVEQQHSELVAKDHIINSLQQDLHRVEPEIEVKVQEIVERDRIIEEKIEKIEQQNKILVEIQITLDEKQKQLADAEQKAQEAQERADKLAVDMDKSCKVIEVFAQKVHTRDKEIANLKRDVAKKEKKARDLVAELKETLDMLKKAKWEAETSGGQDGVKEMAEEENERLWAELESRKNEVLAMQAEHKMSLSQAQDRLTVLQEQLDQKLKDLESQRSLHDKEMEEREVKLREKAEQVARLEGQLQALQGDMSSREGLLKTNQDVVENLQEQLVGVKAELKTKKGEMENLQDELKKKNADMQDLVNKELWERNREVERLQDKLASLTTTTRSQLDAKEEELQRLKVWLAENAGLGKLVAGSVAQVTVVTGSCGPDVVAMNRPVNLNITENGGAMVQQLHQEMNLVREEAKALRLERGVLNKKLSILQQMCDFTSQTTPKALAESEKLDEKRESSQTKEPLNKPAANLQDQMEMLCGELQATKKKIGQQLNEVNVCKYREALRKHKQEIISLKKRLADSHNTCDLLRTRLEELADFLERILELEEQGLINLSQLCPSQVASMHRTLDESRALSRSLSSTLMLGMDFTNQVDPSFLGMSSCSVLDEDLSEIYECPGHDTIAEESLYEKVEAHNGATLMIPEGGESQAVPQNLSCLKERLMESNRQVSEQVKIITELQTEVTRLKEEAQLQHHHCSSADLSEPLPPPPLHLLQDSEGSAGLGEVEGCPVSDQYNPSAEKSGSSTDTAVKAHSSHLEYPQHQQHQHTEVAIRLGVGQDQTWAPVSPSESEAWSEPDRNVSLARIGLDTSSLCGGPDRSVSRTRQLRSTAALTSESEAEVAVEDPISTPLLSPASISKMSKRRLDVAELRRVTTRLKAVEQLNDTLKAELNIYQSLNEQLQPSPPRPRPTTSDKSVETHKGETADAAVGAEEASLALVPPQTPALDVVSLPMPLLEEIRGLRGKLEEAIVNNDQLRDQLEAALTAHPQDEARFFHLTATIQAATDEQRETREKLQASQTALQEQEKAYQQVTNKLEECETRVTQQQQQLEASQQQTLAISEILQEKESALKEQAEQLSEREQDMKQLRNQVSQLQEEAAKASKLQEELQRQEERLLEVNKERMSLVGERARLQAQLASASTQARLQEPHTSLLQQLEAEQCNIASLQKEREQLVVDKEALEKGTEVLQEEVAALQAEITHLKARHSHSGLEGPYQAPKVHTQGQETPHKNSSISDTTTKQSSTEEVQQCGNERHKVLVRQLTAQLEAERQLTTNLQLQLKTLRNTGTASPATTTMSAIHCHDSVVEAISSAESVTSIEYYHQPPPDANILWRQRSPASGSPRDRRSSSNGRRRERESSGQRVSSRWSENKENIFVPATLNTSTTSSISKRSRASLRESQGSILIHHHHSEEDIDGGTTSGESPDLGIGSDHHFSSLERGTTAHHHHHHHTTPTTRLCQSLPLPPSNPLCSEPNHSALMVENQQLREESSSLKLRLVSTEEALKDAVENLSRSNRRKENMERAICKQLHKTHDVLKIAKSHLKQANTLPK